MKKLAVFLLLAMMTACGSSSSDAPYPAAVDQTPHEPVVFGITPTETDTGYSVDVDTLDYDGDIVEIEWSIFFKDDMFAGPEIVAVDMQGKTIMTFCFDIAIDLPEGNYTIYIKATDAAGHESNEGVMFIYAE